MPSWGSWEWVGADLQSELAKYFPTGCFRLDEVPDADVIFIIKQRPPEAWVELAERRAILIYCPIDWYGSARQIDADGGLLQHFARVVVHCKRLARYVNPYARAVYIDHHLKFVSVQRDFQATAGFVLWIGVHSNLPPLFSWLQRNRLSCDLLILTNLGGTELNRIRRTVRRCAGERAFVDRWTPTLHLEKVVGAKAALDIKGEDFRARHKPPAKALDFLASNLPLAMNPRSSAVEHMATLGFNIAPPQDERRWFSRDYWEETRCFGEALRQSLSLQSIGEAYKNLIESLVAEQELKAGT
jgi:hypothetical protein